MIDLIKLQCPNCSANLEVDKSLEQCFCTYCGTKILIQNSNKASFTYVDQAALAAEENKKRALELEEKKRVEDLKRAKKVLIYYAYGILALFIAGFGFGIAKENYSTGGIVITTIQLFCLIISFALFLGISKDKFRVWAWLLLVAVLLIPVYFLVVDF